MKKFTTTTDASGVVTAVPADSFTTFDAVIAGVTAPFKVASDSNTVYDEAAVGVMTITTFVAGGLVDRFVGDKIPYWNRIGA